MSRTQSKYPRKCKAIGERFIYLIERKLGWTLAQAAAELGYANPTTLYAIKRGSALPAPEKLAVAAEKLKDKKGRGIDLHWLFTGKRTPFLDLKPEVHEAVLNNDIIELVRDMSDEQRRALLVLLDRT